MKESDQQICDLLKKPTHDYNIQENLNEIGQGLLGKSLDEESEQDLQIEDKSQSEQIDQILEKHE